MSRVVWPISSVSPLEISIAWIWEIHHSSILKPMSKLFVNNHQWKLTCTLLHHEKKHLTNPHVWMDIIKSPSCSLNPSAKFYSTLFSLNKMLTKNIASQFDVQVSLAMLIHPTFIRPNLLCHKRVWSRFEIEETATAIMIVLPCKIYSPFFNCLNYQGTSRNSQDSTFTLICTTKSLKCLMKLNSCRI